MDTETTSTTVTVTPTTEEAARGLIAWLNTFLHNELLSSAIVFALVMVITAFVAHVVTKALRKFLSRENSPLPSGTIFINIWRVCAWAIGLSIGFASCFNVDVSGAITALGVGGIAISLGLQDTISNLIGGVQMSLMGTVVPGDHIEVGGRKGVVHDITWRQMTMETSNRQMVVVPNSTINNGTLVKLPPVGKIIVPVSFYKNFDNLDEAIDRICATVKTSVAHVAPVTKDPVIQLTSVTEYAYSGNLILWMELDGLDYAVRDDIADIIVRIIARNSPSV